MKKIWFFNMAIVLMVMILPGCSSALETTEQEEQGAEATAAAPATVEAETASAETPATTPAVIEEEETASAETARQLEEERANVAKARQLVVARVNGRPLTMYDLIRAMNKIAPRYAKTETGLTEEVNLLIREEALDRLIYEELAIQEAVRQEIEIDPARIDEVVVKVREGLGSEEAFREYLANAALTEEDLREQIARAHRFEIISGREIYAKVEVDQALVQEAYEKEKDKLTLPEKYLIEDVFFLPADDAAAAENKAAEVLAKIKTNNNDVWKLVLDGSFIVRTIFIKEERHPAVHAAMASMEAGQLSGVVKDKDGLHIFKIKQKEPPRLMSFEEAKNVIEPRFRVPAQEARQAEWRKELLEGAKIEKMEEEAKD